MFLLALVSALRPPIPHAFRVRLAPIPRMFHPFLDAFPAFVAARSSFELQNAGAIAICGLLSRLRLRWMAMKQHSTDNTIPTAADDAVDEADSAVAASKTTDETTAKTTDKISSKTTNDTLPLPCDSAVPRLSRIALPVCSAIGVALAAAIVWAWFPHGSAAWTNPLHEIDAPAHYYFIRKILGEGVGACSASIFRFTQRSTRSGWHHPAWFGRLRFSCTLPISRVACRIRHNPYAPPDLRTHESPRPAMSRLS